ncbi:unnamed protein product [Brassicogethes aeneus]|uniref:PHD-type domain-containing protein n=1 Tax=Brassicogethes aeneus TaxID=1431903 RepID=A0A9P0BCG1_BRAAE|nr:unnamed protein product [Brassicogethes aeneus]
MTSLNDIDTNFVKCIGYLHASENLTVGDKVPLQIFLEEAIKSKTGTTKDFTSLVSVCLKQHRIDDIKIINYEESKQSNSDNELELDLLKEDLLCIVCNEMDVGARNRLLECSDCHSLYHQECHKPVVTLEDSFDGWVCQNCKDANKKKQQVSSSNASSSVPSSSSSSKSSKSSSSHRHSSSSSSYKSSSKDKYKSSSSSSKSSSSSSKPSSSSSSASSSRSSAPPHNLNIISADKRLQIMKKKAAKLQEKKKLPR